MYPRFRNKLHIQELRRFTLCLGAQRDNLVKYLKTTDSKDEFYSISSINEMLNNKTANQALHRTYNVYSAEYNTHVIRKALSLLMQRRVTFTELYEIRSIFEAYESEDLEGMPCNEHTIFRVLKLCGRSIAPLQLQHQLKKMRDDVDTMGRLQLYEFFDIIPQTSHIDKIDISFELVDGKAKDSQLLYKIDDFHSILHTFDEKVQKKLDKDYRKILSKSFHLEASKKCKGRINYINKDKQVGYEQDNRATYLNMKNALKQTNNNISLSRSGRFSRNITDRNLKSRTPLGDQFEANGNTYTPVDTANALLSPLISTRDVDKQSALIEELEWQMLNNDEKYRIGVSKTLEEIKTKKKYRENRNIFSQPPSTARRTADVFTARVSRPSTMNDVFELYSNFDEDVSFRTKVTSSGTIDLVDDPDEEAQPTEIIFKDITLDEDYQLKKQKILERVKLIKRGKRLVDL